MTNYQHTVGEVRPILTRIIDSYPSMSAAAGAIGITRDLTYRILRSPDASGVAKRNYDKIIRHAESLRAGDAQAGSSVVAYARTPEGQRFIDQCRDGSVAA